MTKTKIKEIIDILERTETREEGKEYLKEEYTTRKELIEIAKFIDIPISNIDKMIDAIIEHTIGYKIRSKAIRG